MLDLVSITTPHRDTRGLLGRRDERTSWGNRQPCLRFPVSPIRRTIRRQWLALPVSKYHPLREDALAGASLTLSTLGLLLVAFQFASSARQTVDEAFVSVPRASFKMGVKRGKASEPSRVRAHPHYNSVSSRIMSPSLPLGTARQVVLRWFLTWASGPNGGAVRGNGKPADDD